MCAIYNKILQSEQKLINEKVLMMRMYTVYIGKVILYYNDEIIEAK